MQLCVHAIGDRANRETLDLMATYLEAGDDRRWRIEHSQHIDPTDIPRFAGTGGHCRHAGYSLYFPTPCLPKPAWVPSAPAWGPIPGVVFLTPGAVVTNGTDAPVEDVDPIESFYASVTRARADGKAVFFPEQAMSREEALHSYTAAAAYSAFQEDERGTLAPGMKADFVLLTNDLGQLQR